MHEGDTREGEGDRRKGWRDNTPHLTLTTDYNGGCEPGLRSCVKVEAAVLGSRP